MLGGPYWIIGSLEIVLSGGKYVLSLDMKRTMLCSHPAQKWVRGFQTGPVLMTNPSLLANNYSLHCCVRHGNRVGIPEIPDAG